MENHEESYEFDSLDSVKVLTIHAAKGLESKIVIFAQSYLKNNLMKDKVYPIFNTDLSCKDLFYKPEVFKNNYLMIDYLKIQKQAIKRGRESCICCMHKSKGYTNN